MPHSIDDLINDNIITYQQLTKLRQEGKAAIIENHEIIRELLAAKIIKYEDIASIKNIEQENNVLEALQEGSAIQDLLDYKKITFDQILQLDRPQIDILKNDNILQYFKNEDSEIDLDQIMKFRYQYQANILKNVGVRNLLKKQKIDFNQILSLEQIAQATAIEDETIRSLLKQGIIDFDQIKSIKYQYQIDTLKNSEIFEFLKNKIINFYDILLITKQQYHADILKNSAILRFFKNEDTGIAFEKILQITHQYQADILKNPAILKLLENGVIDLEQILSLQIDQTIQANIILNTLDDQIIQDLLEDGKIDFEQIIKVKYQHQADILKNPETLSLIANNTMSIKQILDLDEVAYQALKHPETPEDMSEILNHLRMLEAIQSHKSEKELLLRLSALDNNIKELIASGAINYKQLSKIENLIQLKTLTNPKVSKLLTNENENKINFDQILQLKHWYQYKWLSTREKLPSNIIPFDMISILNKQLEDRNTVQESDFEKKDEKTNGISSGYVATKKNYEEDKQAWMIKKASNTNNEFQRATMFNEIITAQLYKRSMYDRTPIITPVGSTNSDLISLRSKFLYAFQTIPQFTKSESKAVIGPVSVLLSKVKGAEKLFASMLAWGEGDPNPGNIGVMQIEKNGEKSLVFAKIDHGLSAAQLFTNPGAALENLANACVKHKYAGKIPLSVSKLKESLDQILAISDDEIYHLIETGIDKLRQANIGAKDLSLIIYKDNIVEPERLTLNTYDELRKHYVEFYQTQMRTMRELSKRLGVIEKIVIDTDPNSKKQLQWENGDWLQEIKGQDPELWVKEHANKGVISKEDTDESLKTPQESNNQPR